MVFLRYQKFRVGWRETAALIQLGYVPRRRFLFVVIPTEARSAKWRNLLFACEAREYRGEAGFSTPHLTIKLRDAPVEMTRP